VDVAKERVLSINPEAEVQVFSQGIIPSTYRTFCEGATVICNQVDHIASTIMLHYAADKLRLPLISGSRARWPERHVVTVKLYDYRLPDYHYEIALPHVEERWGVPQAMVERLLDAIRHEQDCPELMRDIAECNATFRQQQMMNVFLHGES
jgi:hypothetical protein